MDKKYEQTVHEKMIEKLSLNLGKMLTSLTIRETQIIATLRMKFHRNTHQKF